MTSGIWTELDNSLDPLRSEARRGPAPGYAQQARRQEFKSHKSALEPEAAKISTINLCRTPIEMPREDGAGSRATAIAAIIQSVLK